jgi:hypothetical protein
VLAFFFLTRYQSKPPMASPDVLVRQVPVPPRPSAEGASSLSSPSPAGRMAHSRQMSSLSMTTFTTTSQSIPPSEPLLRGAEHREDALARRPLRPGASYVACCLLVRLVMSFSSSSPDRGYWERAHVNRMRRWRLLCGVLLSIMGRSPTDVFHLTHCVLNMPS